MSEDASTQLQAWIDRIKAGDPTAHAELLNHACERLRRLTRKMLQDFSGVRRWEGTDDVCQNALLRLHKALQTVPLESVEQFFRLAATQIRRELLDLARHYFGPEGPGANTLRRERMLARSELLSRLMKKRAQRMIQTAWPPGVSSTNRSTPYRTKNGRYSICFGTKA
jgi:RNA polymerase sigma-70 factor (ECF subfamily)